MRRGGKKVVTESFASSYIALRPQRIRFPGAPLRDGDASETLELLDLTKKKG
jgi:hypothetical protein